MHTINIVLYIIINKPFLSNLIMTIIIRIIIIIIITLQVGERLALFYSAENAIIIFPPYHLSSYTMVVMSENLAARGGAEIPEN